MSEKKTPPPHKKKHPGKKTQKLLLVQSRLPASDQAKLKAHAALEGVPMNTKHDEALQEFLDYRDAYLAKGGLPETLYHAPPTDAKIANVFLDPESKKKLDAIADKDKQTASRILYTANVRWMIKNKLKGAE